MQLDLAREQRSLDAFLKPSYSFMQAAMRTDLVTVVHDGFERSRKCLHRMRRREPRCRDVVLLEQFQQSRRADLGTELTARQHARRLHVEGARPHRVTIEVDTDADRDFLA